MGALAQLLWITALVPAIRLQGGRRRFEVILEDIIRDADAQRDATDGELLTRPVAPGARGDVPDILGILVLRRAVWVDVCGHEDVLGGEGVEAPVDAEEDTAEGGVEHGVPDAAELAGHEGADVAELVGDGLGGDVVVVEVAADAVEFVGDEAKGDVVRGVVGEGEVVTPLVVQAKDLEAGAREGGVAGGVRGEGGLEVEMVAVGVRGTLGEPERVLGGSGVETDAGQGTPELEAVLFLPGVDSRIGQCGVEEGEGTYEVCVGRFVCWSRYLSLPGDVAKALVEDSGRRSEQIGAIVSPGETRHRLLGCALCRV